MRDNLLILGHTTHSKNHSIYRAINDIPMKFSQLYYLRYSFIMRM